MITEGLIRDGDTLLCMIPESGRFIISYMHLTAVSAEPNHDPSIRGPPGRAASPSRGGVPLFADRQLREVAEALTAPLLARGWDIRWVDVEPRIAFPFPWPIRDSSGCSPRRWIRRRSWSSSSRRAASTRTRGIGDPGLPGVVPGALASHPVAAEGASRGGPEPEGRHADRVSQHVVLGGDRSVRAAALRGCPARRGGRRDRHTAAVHDTRDHAALAADRQARTLPVVRAGRGRRRRTRSGRRCGSMHRRVGTVSASRGAHRAHPGCGGSPGRARCFVGGARRSGRLGDSARWRRPRAWQRSRSAWGSASWPACR